MLWWNLINDVSGIRSGSDQIIILHNANHPVDACYLDYVTSNPDFVASGNAERQGYTHWALLNKVS